ncbi:hypothetical protein [Streptosporangium sp. NBC_01756]|uniref:hypothetical protein n=1 Tax=Streptosporangium sp. NBC_01756 TaxID=2975950 RepID=UPI002DDAA654|nr:hypothetical protein [Streptosporangium sp. NBC_01756]WSC87081.1 hypothetical protein OIE48_02330 [Streptosporangium sp. NBC_01756]
MRTAISAGVLVLILSGGITMGTATAAAAVTQADCDSGGLIGGLCRAVGTVGDVVNGLTGAVVPPAPDRDAPDVTQETTVDGAGDAPSSPAPDPGAATTDGAGAATTDGAGDDGLLPKALDDVCLPLVASPECTGPAAISAPEEPEKAEKTKGTEGTEEPARRSRPRPSRTGEPETAREEAAPLPAEPLRPPDSRTRINDMDQPVIPQPVPTIDAEAPQIDPLWPGTITQELHERMRELLAGKPPGEQTVTPTRSSDTLGTVLTTALLIAAILAVRLLYTRRTGEESMPLEPLRTGRHRTA